MSTEEKMKRGIIEDMNALSSDEEIVAFLSSKQDRIMLQNTYIEEAKAEGFNNGKVEIAKNILKKNIDINTVSEVTGLELEQIESLLN